MAIRLETLKTEVEFAQFRRTKAFHSRLFRLRFTSRPNQNIARFGFIVPKKLIPAATARNQIRRRLKRIIQANLPKLKPVDILIAPNKEVVGKKYKDLELELTNLFTQARLWKS